MAVVLGLAGLWYDNHEDMDFLNISKVNRRKFIKKQKPKTKTKRPYFQRFLIKLKLVFYRMSSGTAGRVVIKYLLFTQKHTGPRSKSRSPQ